MDERRLRVMLDAVREGELAPDDAVAQLRRLPFADLAHTRVDHHRALRQGLAETVFAPGKTPTQCAQIVAELLAESDLPIVLTRADASRGDHAATKNPGASRTAGPLHNGVPTETLVWRPAPARFEHVVLACAGTSDLPVADECDAVLRAHGVVADRLVDVGVAGLHRLLAEIDRVETAQVVVVVAGMEGALASVIGGLSAAPVIAVPTSVGYGAAFDGVTALLAMLASCAAGVTVVGIDNGFGAAVAVLRTLGATSAGGSGTGT